MLAGGARADHLSQPRADAQAVHRGALQEAECPGQPLGTASGPEEVRANDQGIHRQKGDLKS